MVRIVNIRYKCCGLNFDAAIDCDWVLFCYGERRNDTTTPIELHCFDRKDWDVRTIYQDGCNDQSTEPLAVNHSIVDWDFIIRETRKWVREMKKSK